MNYQVIAELLISGLADWIFFNEFIGNVRLCCGIASEEAAVGQACEVLRYMLEQGFVRVGDPVAKGGASQFRPWPGSTDEIIARVKSKCEAAPKQKDVVDPFNVCWGLLTPLGKEVGELVLADRRAGPEKWINKPNK